MVNTLLEKKNKKTKTNPFIVLEIKKCHVSSQESFPVIHFLLSSSSPAGAEVTALFQGFNRSSGCDRLTCGHTHKHTLLTWTKCASPQSPVIYPQAQMSYWCKSSRKISEKTKIKSRDSKAKRPREGKILFSTVRKTLMNDCDVYTDMLQSAGATVGDASLLRSRSINVQEKWPRVAEAEKGHRLISPPQPHQQADV